MLLMQINPTEASHNKRVLTTRLVSSVETLKIINRRDSAVCYFDITDTPRRAFWVTCCVSFTLTGLTRHRVLFFLPPECSQSANSPRHAAGLPIPLCVINVVFLACDF